MTRANGGFVGGVLLAVIVSVLAELSARWMGESLLGFDKSPISAIMMAIIVGMLIANTVRLPEAIQPGLRFCLKVILKIGIVLLGIRLSLFGAGQFALVALPFVAAAITTGLVTVSLLGRMLGLSRQLSGLIAVGTSICGCTAIVATAPLLRAKESEVSYAIACITVFGVAAMFAYPIVAQLFFSANPELAGLFIGTSIHETAQVAGAGLMYEAQYGAPAALDSATVTKLVRNLSMIAVIPLIAVIYGADRSDRAEVSIVAMIPWFIVGFAAMSAIRTIGDMGDKAFGFILVEDWHRIVDFIRDSAERLLLIAMSAVGLTSMIRGIVSIGLRPFMLGLFAALIIGVLSLLLIGVFGNALLQLTGELSAA